MTRGVSEATGRRERGLDCRIDCRATVRATIDATPACPVS